MELLDHLVGPRREHPVAADQIGVVVNEPRLTSGKASGRVQVEENGAAAEERLDVPVEGDGVVAAKRRKQLTLAASPLEQGPSGRRW